MGETIVGHLDKLTRDHIPSHYSTTFASGYGVETKRNCRAWRLV